MNPIDPDKWVDHIWVDGVGVIEYRGRVEALQVIDGKLFAITSEGVAEVQIPPDESGSHE